MISVQAPSGVTGPTAPAASPTASLAVAPAVAASPSAAVPSISATPAAATSSTPAARPAWLPEKFATAEAMATAYGDLYRQFTGKQQAAKGTTPATSAPVATPAAGAAAPLTAAAATTAVTDAGLSMDKFVAEHGKDGKLSDASYAELAAKGFTKQIADDFIAGQQARAAQSANTILETIGGRAEFDKATAWAKANLPPKDIEAFNRAVQKGTTEDAEMAVKGLYGRFKSASPSEPNFIKGGTAGVGDGFTSTAQLTTAMSDPRYRKDPIYRADVERRVGASNLFGLG